MARLGRTFLPDQPLHVIARGNNRGAVCFGEHDFAQYGGWLAEAADGYGCRIHATVFMTNHLHLLVTPERGDSLPRTLQSSGRATLCAHHQHGVSPNRNALGGAHPGRADRP
jgi:putative transposase